MRATFFYLQIMWTIQNKSSILAARATYMNADASADEVTVDELVIGLFGFLRTEETLVRDETTVAVVKSAAV